MKTLGTMTFAVAIVSALALAQTRSVTLVKGSPTTSAFDISWVDNSTQKYYLADRTNNAIDLVDAATDTFLGFIGKGQYTGSVSSLMAVQWILRFGMYSVMETCQTTPFTNINETYPRTLLCSFSLAHSANGDTARRDHG